MGTKKVFYLDPSMRNWSAKDVGLRWDIFVEEGQSSGLIEGHFFANNRKLVEVCQLPNHCVECLAKLSYNDEFDSTFCTDCDEWRETACDDPYCDYCVGRPAKPSNCK